MRVVWAVMGFFINRYLIKADQAEGLLLYLAIPGLQGYCRNNLNTDYLITPPPGQEAADKAVSV